MKPEFIIILLNITVGTIMLYQVVNSLLIRYIPTAPKFRFWDALMVFLAIKLLLAK